jgi:FKBP12-rapamycin complex-associated protein
MISNHREKENKKSLTNKELASLLGVRPNKDRSYVDEAEHVLTVYPQYDPETFTPHGLDAPGEMDRYDKLPLETKVERLKAAMSHCDQSERCDAMRCDAILSLSSSRGLD